MKCPESLHCKDSKCEQQSHDKAREDLVLDVLCAIVETSYTFLPLTGCAGGPSAHAQQRDRRLRMGRERRLAVQEGQRPAPVLAHQGGQEELLPVLGRGD